MLPPHIADLHDRSSRGELLSDDDQAILNAWYAEQDQAEGMLLGRQPSDDTAHDMHQQIIQAARHLEQITQQITATIAANDAIRKEIAILHTRLAQHVSGRAA
jgi:hypothetical protein